MLDSLDLSILCLFTRFRIDIDAVISLLLSDMSETVLVQLYYGYGEIRYGDEGVDLSSFNSVVKDVKRAVERTWEGITNWLYKAFSVDTENYDLSIMARLNRSYPIYWELIPIQGTRHWKS